MKAKGDCSAHVPVHLRCTNHFLAVAVLAALIAQLQAAPPEELPQTSSSPITITRNDRQVWVVNPDNDSVSVINVHRDAHRKLAEIVVGDEPRFVAQTGQDRNVFVSNSRSGTV